MLPWQDVTQAADWLNVWPDEIYGSTETGILAWRYRHQDDVAWLPFPGVRFQPEDDLATFAAALAGACRGSPLLAGD